MNKNQFSGVIFAVATSLIASYLWERYSTKPRTLKATGAIKEGRYYSDLHEFISASPYVDNYGFTNESGMLN